MKDNSLKNSITLKGRKNSKTIGDKSSFSPLKAMNRRTKAGTLKKWSNPYYVGQNYENIVGTR